MSISLQPLQAIKRDTSLDVLRGFALAGVLFIFCTSDIKSSANYVNSFWDELIAWPKWVLVENRMYTMLILIFGFGFGVQLQKAQQIQKSLVPVFLRRLAGLLIIGSIHALLLSKRDILIFYAIAGFALLPVRNLTNRQVLIIASVLFVFWHLMLLSCVCLYASILISVSATAKRKIWFTPLAAFGQMALSNYLIQSLLLVPYLLWFDKFNNMPSLNGFILFLIVFAFQLVFSTWWLSDYNFGPFEWLLRSFTYWKWQSC